MAVHSTGGWDAPYKVHDAKLVINETDRAHRIAICESCPRFRNHVCKETRTFLPPYTWLTFAHCPQTKW
jgi:hypothetical protein